MKAPKGRHNSIFELPGQLVYHCQNNQITNIKVSNTMLDINSQSTQSACKELKISGFQLAEMLRIAADLA